MWVYTREFLSRMAASITAGAGADSISLQNYRLGLLKAPPVPTVDSEWGDVSASLANYTGYGSVSIGTIGDPFIGPGNLTMIEGTAKLFRPTDDAVPNTIYAGVLTGPGADSLTLMGLELLDVPVPLPGPDYQLTYVPRFGFDPAANWGLSIVSP